MQCLLPLICVSLPAIMHYGVLGTTAKAPGYGKQVDLDVRTCVESSTCNFDSSADWRGTFQLDSRHVSAGHA